MTEQLVFFYWHVAEIKNKYTFILGNLHFLALMN